MMLCCTSNQVHYLEEVVPWKLSGARSAFNIVISYYGTLTVSHIWSIKLDHCLMIFWGHLLLETSPGPLWFLPCNAYAQCSIMLSRSVSIFVWHRNFRSVHLSVTCIFSKMLHFLSTLMFVTWKLKTCMSKTVSSCFAPQCQMCNLKGTVYSSCEVACYMAVKLGLWEGKMN